MPYKSQRVDIISDTVKEAARLAARALNSIDICDWFDRRQHYLQLRQRGKTVRWYVRARGRSQLLGDALLHRGVTDGGYLSISEARDEAASVYARNDPTPKAPAAVPSWAWADLDRKFQDSLKEIRVTKSGRIKYPSAGTQDDVRLMLNKAPITAWGKMSINELTADMIADAINDIHQNHGHRTCCKSLTYVKSAMNYALKKRRESGLVCGTAWWMMIEPPDPNGNEIQEIIDRKATLTKAKSDFTVDHLGELLVKHEEYCAGRTAELKISPGIRWGVWWICYTGNRRRSPTVLRREELLMADPFAEVGWGRAMWGAHQMKGQAGFWLPLPPDALHIAVSSMQDWRALVNKSHGFHHNTQWVFSSTRRIGRNPDTLDVAVNGSSLSHYLADLRADYKLDKRLPKFTMQLTRSVIGNFLDHYPGMPSSASSLLLSHAMKNGSDEAAPTTKRFYLTSQRMDVKAQAMRAWSDALTNAYLKAGGTPPMPSEK